MKKEKRENEDRNVETEAYINLLYRPVLVEEKSSWLKPVCYTPVMKRNTRSQLRPQNRAKLMLFVQYCTNGTIYRDSLCTHHFLPIRNCWPLVITVHDYDVPEVMLLQCWAQVIGDEFALFLGWIPAAINKEVRFVAISRFILRGQAPDVDAFYLVSLQEAVIRI